MGETLSRSCFEDVKEAHKRHDTAGVTPDAKGHHHCWCVTQKLLPQLNDREQVTSMAKSDISRRLQATGVSPRPPVAALESQRPPVYFLTFCSSAAFEKERNEGGGGQR